MAAPISHLVFGKRILERLNSKKEASGFYTGVCFPDIRYLGIIDRNISHPEIKSISELENESPFFAGVKCHVLLDEIREKYMQDKGIYNLTPNSKYITQALKFYEDQLLYQELTQIDNLSNFLNHIFQEEINFQIPIEDLQKWHSMIKKYINSKARSADIKQFLEMIPKGEDIWIEVSELLPRFKDSVQITLIIKEFYKDFDLLLDPSS